MGHIGDVISSFRNVLWNDAANFLRLEDRAGGKVIKRKLWFGTAGARHACACLGRLAIPKNPITWRVSHWPPAAELIEEATRSGSLSEFDRGLFIFEVLNSRTSSLSKRLEEGLWPLQIVK